MISLQLFDIAISIYMGFAKSEFFRNVELRDRQRLDEFSLVPGGGIEPPRCHQRGILSPVRLPIPPSRLIRIIHCCIIATAQL